MPPKHAKAKVTPAVGSSSLPFVSVLTPTYNRRKFIPAAIRCFRNQTYPHDRMEWIIYDDGTDPVKDLFDAAIASGLTNIRYHAASPGEKLPIGAKRNKINELATGDICVCWDDDDYYPPDRIRRAVTRLRSMVSHKVPFVGSSQLYLYFTDRDQIWSLGPYNENHCTNGTMAYWRSYFGEHRYDDTATKAEEKSFMNDWKTSVYQMPPEDVMLVICHADNTYDKRELFKHNNPLFKRVNMKLNQIVKDKELREFYQGLAKDYAAKDAAAAAHAEVIAS